MSRKRNLVAGAIAFMIVAVAACSNTKDLVVPPPPVNPLFASYVSLGNSITAGFQSGGINDSTQHQAYPVLLARQMNTPFTVASLRDPGCPPPIDTFPQGTRVGGGTSTTCFFRSQGSGVVVLNNVAVPGAASFDPASPIGTGGGGSLTTFILGGKTQVQRALDAKPTFVSIWIGNNDVLPAALSGVLDAVPGLSPGVTNEAAFEQNYSAMMTGLDAGGTIKGGILIGVVNVTNAPVFFPAAALFAPGVLPALRAVAGRPITVDTSCTPTTQSIISIELLAAIRAGAAPDTIACHALSNHANGLGQVFVLDATEIAAVSQAVAGYNAFIQQTAANKGWAFLDPNPALAQLRQSGQIPVLPDLTQPTKPFGDFISLDGIHPAAAAHVLLGNLMIQSINSQYSTSIPTLASP